MILETLQKEMEDSETVRKVNGFSYFFETNSIHAKDFAPNIKDIDQEAVGHELHFETNPKIKKGKAVFPSKKLKMNE